MKIKIKNMIFVSVLFIGTLVNSQTRNQAYLAYIEQYYKLAEKQQRDHRIPASIILAQGLLESGAGLSDFSKNSNNHFGIKCSDWTGDKIYKDDDSKGECFRKYDHVVDSYEDHSSFLKTRNRYAFLFDLKLTDYEAWAFGLKKAGYATDPTYAYKLISIIEDYNLHRFDLGKNYEEIASKHQKVSTTNSEERNSFRLTAYKDVNVKHEVMKVNKVRFVTSISGDTYKKIANEFDLSEDRIRIYNEVDSFTKLKPGSRVFISPKRKKAPKECLTHTVQGGETMLSISQDYGIKIVELYKLNNMTFTEGAYYGRVLKLR